MFLDDIYWGECVRLWAMYSQEYEVRTYPNGRVMLTEIQVGDKTLSMKSFDGPRILKSTYFGDNEFFHGNIAGLGYYNYNKRLIDRQGNEYTEKEYLQQVQQLLKNARDISEIADFYGNEKEGFIRFCVGDKENFVTKDGELLSLNQWFDWCKDFKGGFAEVKLFLKWYYIDYEGNITEEKPQVSESRIRDIIRECIMDFIKMDMINEQSLI